MNIAYINSFTERFATICGHDFNPHELMNNFPSDADYGKNDFREIIDEVIKNANKINLTILESSIHKKDFNNFLKNINYPFLAIYNKSLSIVSDFLWSFPSSLYLASIISFLFR